MLEARKEKYVDRGRFGGGSVVVGKEGRNQGYVGGNGKENGG